MLKENTSEELLKKIVSTVGWFSAEMINKLFKEVEDKDKRDWQPFTEDYLFFRLLEEVAELSEALMHFREDYFGHEQKLLAKKVLAEAVDVAALAMFIADNVIKGANNVVG